MTKPFEMRPNPMIAGIHMRAESEARKDKAISNALTELQCIDCDNFDVERAKENITYAIKALLKGKENV